MATLKMPQHDYDISTSITDTRGWTEVVQPLDTIQGQMITATLEIDEFQIRQMDDVDMKNKVLNMLVNELIAAKCIEFTKQHDVATNTTKVRARIFATPDTQIRVIRSATK